ncbi:hypothetical protein DP107_18465 [Haloglomus irregulare]|uniref:Uncharacterized protein n=1 Tax=Haloglomus irregulare TaxID=2234134 RepID=A0A554MUE7_9EURY|nr:hypothetical protein DP107_18465 [Haloglomus irregulare]
MYSTALTRISPSAEVADAAEVSKEHVRTTLKRLVDADAELVECREEAGAHDAHLYRALAGLGTEPAVVDTTPEETANSGVWYSVENTRREPNHSVLAGGLTSLEIQYIERCPLSEQ